MSVSDAPCWPSPPSFRPLLEPSRLHISARTSGPGRRTVPDVERDYSATPLAKKLGLGPEMTVVALNAPAGAVEKLTPVPHVQP